MEPATLNDTVYSVQSVKEQQMPPTGNNPLSDVEVSTVEKEMAALNSSTCVSTEYLAAHEDEKTSATPRQELSANHPPSLVTAAPVDPHLSPLSADTTEALPAVAEEGLASDLKRVPNVPPQIAESGPKEADKANVADTAPTGSVATALADPGEPSRIAPSAASIVPEKPVVERSPVRLAPREAADPENGGTAADGAPLVSDSAASREFMTVTNLKVPEETTSVVPPTDPTTTVIKTGEKSPTHLEKMSPIQPSEPSSLTEPASVPEHTAILSPTEDRPSIGNSDVVMPKPAEKAEPVSFGTESSLPSFDNPEAAVQSLPKLEPETIDEQSEEPEPADHPTSRRPNKRNRRESGDSLPPARVRKESRRPSTRDDDTEPEQHTKTKRRKTLPARQTSSIRDTEVITDM